jgi:hypothetical protein
VLAERLQHAALRQAEDAHAAALPNFRLAQHLAARDDGHHQGRLHAHAAQPILLVVGEPHAVRLHLHDAQALDGAPNDGVIGQRVDLA